MDRHLEDKEPLRDRIVHLRADLDVLSRAINEELDWREKLNPTPADEPDDAL